MVNHDLESERTACKTHLSDPELMSIISTFLLPFVLEGDGVGVTSLAWARLPALAGDGMDVRTHNYQTKVKRCRLTSEQGEEETVYIDKNITLVGGDFKRIRLSYLMTD